MPEVCKFSATGMSAASIVESTASSMFGSETMRLACLLIVISKRLRAVRALPKVSSRAKSQSYNKDKSVKTQKEVAAGVNRR